MTEPVEAAECECRTWTYLDTLTLARLVIGDHHSQCENSRAAPVDEVLGRLIVLAERWRKERDEWQAAAEERGRKLAEAGVEGSPPPGRDTLIGSLRTEIDRHRWRRMADEQPYIGANVQTAVMPSPELGWHYEIGIWTQREADRDRWTHWRYQTWPDETRGTP